MVASALIIGFSFILLVYWFRYSCILLLRNHADRAVLAPAAPDNRFSFPEVRERLRTEVQLDVLHRSLERDYRVITYLREHAAGLGLEGLEDRLLVVDYRTMQWWYRLTRAAAPRQARQALSEMASILEVLVSRIERADARSQA